MAHRTKTVGPGKDYETLALALAGEAVVDYNLLDDTTDEIYDKSVALEFQLYAMTELAKVTLPNFATDAAHWIYIRVMPGEGHTGFWDATKYNLSPATADKALFGVEDYVLFEGLQFQGNADYGVHWDANAAPVVFLNCLFRSTVSPLLLVNATAVLNNCISHSSNPLYYIEQQGAGSVVSALNCTFASGYAAFGGTTDFKNCYAYHPTEGYAYYNSGGTPTFTTCASSDATVRSGVTASVPFSTATFLSVTFGTTTYLRVFPSGPLEDTGTSLILDANWVIQFAVDIAGTARVVWDIGAFEDPISGVQYSRPTADVTDGHWLNEGESSGNLYESVGEEVASDTTYIVSAAMPANDLCELQLSALSEPGLASTCRIRIRARWVA